MVVVFETKFPGARKGLAKATDNLEFVVLVIHPPQWQEVQACVQYFWSRKRWGNPTLRLRCTGSSSSIQHLKQLGNRDKKHPPHRSRARGRKRVTATKSKTIAFKRQVITTGNEIQFVGRTSQS